MRMSLRLGVLVLALAAPALRAAAQQPPAAAPAGPPPGDASQVQPAGALAPLRFLLGEWEAIPGADSTGGAGAASFSVALQGRAIVRTSFAEYPADAGRPASRHDDLMVIFAEGDGVRADYYDNEGHVIRYGVAARAPGEAVFVSDAVPAAPRYRLTYVLAPDGTLGGRFEIAPPGAPEAFHTYLTWTTRPASGGAGLRPAPARADTIVTVPEGTAPTLDGTLSPGEWSAALVTTLAGGSRLRLMQAGGFLYLGLQPKPTPVLSVCAERGNEVVVMHASGSLGTARYTRNADGSYSTGGWSAWCCGDSTLSAGLRSVLDAYERTWGWSAPNGRLGEPGDMELKLAMPQGRVRLALTYVAGPDFEPGGWPGSVWPTDLSDDCASRNLVTGDPPARARFTPARWVTVVAGPAGR